MSGDCPPVGHNIPRRLEVEAASGSLRGIDHSGVPIFAIMHNIQLQFLLLNIDGGPLDETWLWHSSINIFIVVLLKKKSIKCINSRRRQGKISISQRKFIIIDIKSIENC